VAAISSARKAAFQILIAVERGQSHSDDLLRGKSVNLMSAPDRHLATTLVLGVLRWQILLDNQLHSLLKRPNAKLEPEIRIALRMGAFQLLHLDRIPARAAIDESVELAKQAGHRFASGMVNAVLRKLSSIPREDLPEGSPTELALAKAHPGWMVERWVDLYGLEAARAICHHGQTQPVLTARLAAPEVETELSQAGVELQPGELLTAARIVVHGDVNATTAFREGRVRMQDEGSQLVGEIAASIGSDLDREAKSILDMCAAPGGKTLILADRNHQARIVACEASPQRLKQLRDRLADHAARVECRLADATALTEFTDVDLALADVPCSGTGTLGRNPEIRHRLQIADLPRQADRQRKILSAALRALRPGGRVVYSTCSFEPEENEQVVAAVLAEDATVRQNSLASRIKALADESVLTPSGATKLQTSLTSDGALRLLPGVFHSDGFFIAMLEKSA
jgi:16S rRNA (cytosine967-C5)-methyltransferase